MKDSSAKKQPQNHQPEFKDRKEKTSTSLVQFESPKPNFRSFLKEIRKKAKSESEKGTLFEKAIRDFLKQSPEHSFEDVWMRKEWPELKKYGFPVRDLGIDLIAKEKETGKLWAIQCKCFDENYQVNKPDIDSFFTESGKEPFEVRLIVTTTNNWGANAEEALKSQTKECKVLGLHDLEKVDFEWNLQSVKRKTRKKQLRLHQKEAVNKSEEYFKTQDRGKLIMACGTGKTFTSLRITEKITPENGNILFLAPSISLVSQTLREYAYERKESQRYLVVCSDTKAGKDSDGMDINDLQISPTTDPKRIAERLKIKSKGRTIVFSTYQSLKQIKEAQNLGAPQFDLTICDEAHRTTGVEGSETKDKKTKGNYFTMINDENYVKAKKRLYMTATPRIYNEKIKSKAKKHQVEIHSMDEESVYGKEIYRLDFSRAIEQKLLVDYKVIILSIDEQYMSDHIQEALTNTGLNLADASKLVGCYKALRDQGNEEEGINLSRAVGFLNTIQDSKNVKEGFQTVVDVLDDYENDGYTCETEHIDGTDSSIKRNKKLDWLKADAGYTQKHEKICRILMNSKCLTEGIDVPSLDAVMFLNPRKSQVDVVQAVGRVIRKQDDKKYGYVILPVVIPSGKSPEEALNDNQTYKVVWQVLNALRSHDSEFNSLVNNLELNKQKPDKIKVLGIGFGSEEEEREFEEKTDPQIRLKMQYNIEDIEEKIYAKIVEKCGDRIYEEKWAKEIENACKTISTRIKSLLKQKPEIKKEFKNYYEGLKSSINKDIKEEEAISMLSEHLLTKPAFDKIFEDYQFSENNPVSKTMKKVLDKLDVYGFRNELKDLQKFYDGISKRMDGIDNSESRQKIIKELYENFIKTAFPKTAEKLGVAYTPVEIVDFIIKSADEILRKEFKKGLTDKGVHVIDPFVGTGTFINRLISNENLIKKDDLQRKFKEELHANEILLLPYYVSSINIEEAYNSRMGGRYKEFPGITLTDTFNIYEQKDNVIPLFQENKKRIKRQKESAIQVIVGNPPYSSGQNSENDANKNTVHPLLHKRIEESYVKESDTTFRGALYDSYIKAIRWATDRIGNEGGIIGFVHNASLVNERSIGGLRKSLEKEFDSIYCFNLRGNARIKGEQRKKEKDNVFGQSTRTPVAITFLVKNPESQKTKAQIKYHDIGDYLSRDKKLEKIKSSGSVEYMNWQDITPDKYGDWINQRDDSFYQFLPLGDKKEKRSDAIFDLYSCGIKTNRDLWVYNFNKNRVKENMKRMIDFYNQELNRLKDKEINKKNIDNLINRDDRKIKWTRKIKKYFMKKENLSFDKICIRQSSYRPFMKSWLYFSEHFNEEIYHNDKMFFKNNTENKVIYVSSIGAKTFSVLMTDAIPDLQYLQNGQCFPYYKFDESGSQKEAITDKTLGTFKNYYQSSDMNKHLGPNVKSISDVKSSKEIQKEDIFYYIYGLLHSEDYQTKYKSNLDKSLPHIPLVPDFWQFSNTGRELADLHLNYENHAPPQEIKILKQGKEVDSSELNPEELQVTKMKYDKKDKTKIQFNEHITISHIPEKAWNYKINGWSAPKWIIERYQYKKDKKTEIINDPNTYSEDPAYILELLLSVITVSLKTQELVKNLPAIDFDKLSEIKEVSYVQEKELREEIIKTPVEKESKKTGKKKIKKSI